MARLTAILNITTSGRLYWSLDIDNFEKPLEAFRNKSQKRSEKTTQNGWGLMQMMDETNSHMIQKARISEQLKPVEPLKN